MAIVVVVTVVVVDCHDITVSDGGDDATFSEHWIDPSFSGAAPNLSVLWPWKEHVLSRKNHDVIESLRFPTGIFVSVRLGSSWLRPAQLSLMVFTCSWHFG